MYKSVCWAKDPYVIIKDRLKGNVGRLEMTEKDLHK
jgi:hypothetical protein